MECRDVREMADSFLGQELLTETNHEILHHLHMCPSCRADMEGRRALRAALRNAFARAEDLAPRDGFADEVRRRLRGAAVPERSHRRFASPRVWAMAAALVITIGSAAAFWARGWTAVMAMTRAAAGDHRYCALKFRLAEKPITLDEAARLYDASYRSLLTAPPRDLPALSGAARVLERHSCVYDGRRFAHIVIAYRGQVVSLLVTATPANSQPLIAPRVPWRHEQVDDLAVAAASASGHAVLLVGALDRADMDRLMEAVAMPLLQQLATVPSA